MAEKTEKKAKPTKSGKARKARPTGIMRIWNMLEKASVQTNRANELLNRWSAVGKNDDGLAALTENLGSVTQLFSSMADTCDSMNKADWSAPTKTISVKLSDTVTLKNDHVGNYESQGIGEGLLLKVIGPGPVRGTLSVKLPDGTQTLVGKKHVKAVKSDEATA